MTSSEPAWTEQDRAEIFALELYRSWLCPLHGGPLEECTSHEDTGPDFHVRRTRCRAQDAVLAEQESLKIDRPGAVLWSVQARNQL
ncbi:hypothetical protein [Actinoplanes sp. NPDC051851]|uniref:hypothetical protein n=1 Tax=Actinoplanes sp. NPDC051851 TaxID=3154753 RepID=UPI0034313CE6